MNIPYHEIRLIHLKCNRTYMAFNGELYEVIQYYGNNVVCSQCHFYKGHELHSKEGCDLMISGLMLVRFIYVCEAVEDILNFPVERCYLSKLSMSMYLAKYLKRNVKHEYEININGYADKIESYHSRI